MGGGGLGGEGSWFLTDNEWPGLKQILRKKGVSAVILTFALCSSQVGNKLWFLCEHMRCQVVPL